jgi:hypothetical protein
VFAPSATLLQASLSSIALYKASIFKWPYNRRSSRAKPYDICSL